MTSRRVSWQRIDETPMDEVCAMSVRDSGLSLVGTVLGADGGVPLRIEYRVLTDAAGLTAAANVREQRGFGQHTLTLLRDVKGAWTGDGIRTAPCGAARTWTSASARPRTRCLSAGCGCRSVRRRPSTSRGSGSLASQSRRWRRRTRAWTSSRIARRAGHRGRADRRRRRARHHFRGVAPNRAGRRGGGPRAARRPVERQGEGASQTRPVRAPDRATGFGRCSRSDAPRAGSRRSAGVVEA